HGGAHAAEPRPPTPGRTLVGPGSRESAMKTLHSRNLDDVLRDFYRSEMPEPWPALNAPARPEPMKRPQRLRFRALSRLALAAAVAFLLIGYLALASLFPTQQPRPGLQGGPPTAYDGIGPDSRPRKKAELRVVPEEVRTPGGREAKMLVEPINGGFIINL